MHALGSLPLTMAVSVLVVAFADDADLQAAAEPQSVGLLASPIQLAPVVDRGPSACAHVDAPSLVELLSVQVHRLDVADQTTFVWRTLHLLEQASGARPPAVGG